MRLASVVAMVVGAWLVSGSAEAGTITFYDLSDGVTFTSDTTRATAFNCPTTTETCIVDIAFPQDAVAAVSTFVLSIAEPGGVVTSDTLDGQVVSVNGISVFRVTFVSDVEGNLGLCGPLGCGIAEDGTSQLGGLIIFFTATRNSLGTDIVRFQSDVSDVPEPASLLLLGTGLVGGARRWRKRQPSA
jgi:hypothetical protein